MQQMNIYARHARYALGVLVTAAALVPCGNDPRSAEAQNSPSSNVGESRSYYENYCTPCHAVGGGPGPALFRTSKQPVDLRTYVSQAIAGLIAVPEGTAVFYTERVSTDQLTGFGSALKQSIGRNRMAKQLTETFERSRTCFVEAAICEVRPTGPVLGR